MRHVQLLAGLGLTVLVAMLAVPAAAQRSPARVALIIANAAYPDAGKPLPFATKDATAIAAELRRLNFNVEVKTDLDKREIRQAIDTFIDRIGRGETALFYFTGFGLQVERQTYLMPVDAQIWAAADLRRDGVSANALVSRMQHKGAGAKIIIIDAGRRNPFERRFRSAAAGLAPFEMPAGTLTLYSTAIGKTAEDVGSGGHSLFAATLLRQLRSPDASVEHLFNRARIDVSRASAGKQVPWVASSLIQEINLNDESAPAAAVPERITAAPPVNANSGLSDSKNASTQQNSNKAASPGPKVVALPSPSKETETSSAKTTSDAGIAQAGRWQTVVRTRRHKIVCVFNLQPDGHYRFSDRCPAPYTGETGDADIKGKRYIMRAKSGRVERGTIEMDGKDRLIARSGGGRVVWTRVE
jgi:hypothetical protein